MARGLSPAAGRFKQEADKPVITMSDQEQLSLSTLRVAIDEIDDQLLQLFNQRAGLALKVALVKQADGETDCFHRPEREAEVLSRLMDESKGPLPREAVGRLFREVMSECLAIEKPLEVACLGPEGTFTQQAAYRHFGHAIRTRLSVTVEDVFRRVESGEVQYGVVPVENSTEGVVAVTLDRFLNSSLVITGEVHLRIHHCLMARNTPLSTISEIRAHQQSLAQCRRWLDQNLPNVPRTPVASNAEAARMAAEQPGIAAIAGRPAAEIYGLECLAGEIEDEPNNTTRFLVIGQTPVGPTQSDRTSLLLTIPNDPGSLYGVLEPFARHGISLSKIESRPSRRDVWDYVFFVDVEGHHTEASLHKALEEVRRKATLLKVLGSYPKSRL